MKHPRWQSVRYISIKVIYLNVFKNFRHVNHDRRICKELFCCYFDCWSASSWIISLTWFQSSFSKYLITFQYCKADDGTDENHVILMENIRFVEASNKQPKTININPLEGYAYAPESKLWRSGNEQQWPSLLLGTSPLYNPQLRKTPNGFSFYAAQKIAISLSMLVL